MRLAQAVLLIVFVFEGVAPRRHIAAQTRDHGIEGALERAHVGQQGHVGRHGVTVLLGEDHGVDGCDDRGDQGRGVDDKKLQRRLPAQLIVAKLEQIGRQLLPVFQCHLERSDVAIHIRGRFAAGTPVALDQQRLKLGQIGVEVYAPLLIALPIGLVAKGQITADIA